MKGIKHECQLMERCDGHDHGGGVRQCGKVSYSVEWCGVTAVSTLRDDLTFIVSVSLRKYDIFSTTHTTSPILFQPFFPSASFYHKIQESMQIREIPRIW